MQAAGIFSAMSGLTHIWFHMMAATGGGLGHLVFLEKNKVSFCRAKCHCGAQALAAGGVANRVSLLAPRTAAPSLALKSGNYSLFFHNEKS